MKTSVWVSYPLKQGLKLNPTHCGRWNHECVWVSYPLKQGLKRTYSWLGQVFRSCLSQLSIKTRIETIRGKAGVVTAGSLSQLSIKTRIETLFCGQEERDQQSVWVSYPLKQGLKRGGEPVTVPVSSGLSQLSIKTRIETYWLWNIWVHIGKFESAIH